MANDPKKEADKIADDLDIDWSEINDQLIEMLKPLNLESRREVLAALGRDDMFQQADQDAIDFAKQRAAELVGMRIDEDGNLTPNPNAEWSISESTREMIRDKIVEGLTEGKTPNQVQTELMEDGFGAKRALVISRTESAIAHNEGQMSAAQNAGVQFKEWLVSDSEVCDECLENQDAGRIPVEDSFPSGDDNPPLHPNCRCACQYFYEPAEAE